MPSTELFGHWTVIPLESQAWSFRFRVEQSALDYILTGRKNTLKQLLLRALFISLLVGSLIGFVEFVLSVRVTSRFEPPISQDEMQKLRELPIAKAEAALEARRVKYTRTQWLADSIGYSYFWKDVARDSWVPILGVFFACICIARLERGIAARNRGRASV
jgi:hypothetical protein